MAADLREIVIDLRGNTENTEREKKFWNVNEVEMKSTFEREWIKAIRRARRRPNYGMGNMNSGLEEICGNKLELTGPLIDSYLLEIVLFRGYGAEVTFDNRKSKVISTFNLLETAEKIFSPARFEGQDVLRKRHFSRQPDNNGTMRSVYKGRSAVAISQTTPFCFDYNLKNQKVTVTFYIQRYTAQDFVIDSSLQSLMSQ
ncbi:unnamed protein product [Porites evermanni]|uniref:Uncharacterized protein n=1 Tax=Porites evermanni TaxID=104178 RepID=A0ABN8LLF7_9CNID|nr:unnamed protein product [Porites evermanni]